MDFNEKIVLINLPLHQVYPRIILYYKGYNRVIFNSKLKSSRPNHFFDYPLIY